MNAVTEAKSTTRPERPSQKAADEDRLKTMLKQRGRRVWRRDAVGVLLINRHGEVLHGGCAQLLCRELQ